MLYQISHQTIYTYNQPVLLKPHIVRLRPRDNNWQKLHNFSLLVSPQPQGITELVDLDDNNLTKLWFTEPTNQLSLQTLATVETLIDNPFNYLLEPWAIQLPFDYPYSLWQQLQAYLQQYSFVPDAVALELAQEILHKTQGNTISFLATLNQYIYEKCEYIIRETGEPWQAGITWRNKQGSCRDFTVLFMEVCRAIGIATRFVSGYQEGDRDQTARDLHAWVEVYLPGAGWRGYDPTLGLAVSDRHIPVAAAANPRYASAVAGTISPVTSMTKQSQLPTSQMQIQILLHAESSTLN
ncbi:MAG TPA: transglutaminase N-terminal domain-containing protein [Xenococcaceae cyanobacterium]